MAVIDSYSETNQDQFFRISANHPGFRSVQGQSFHCSVVNHKLTQAAFFLKKSPNLPSTFIYAKLYPHSGVFGETSAPIGEPPLATSEPVNTDQISSVDYGYVVFDFVDEQYPFQIDTDYCIAVGFVASGLLEGVSEILVGMDQTAPAHAGNVFAYMNGWSSQPGAYDLCFYVYGEPFTPPPPQVNITIMATLGGTTEPIPNTYSVVQNTDISVQAVPGVTLNHWELDGVNVGMANPHILLADMDHVLIAVFDQLVQTFLVALNSSPIQGIPFTIERIG